jgi:hypothetical protein
MSILEINFKRTLSISKNDRFRLVPLVMIECEEVVVQINREGLQVGVRYCLQNSKEVYISIK